MLIAFTCVCVQGKREEGNGFSRSCLERKWRIRLGLLKRVLTPIKDHEALDLVASRGDGVSGTEHFWLLCSWFCSEKGCWT